MFNFNRKIVRKYFVTLIFPLLTVAAVVGEIIHINAFSSDANAAFSDGVFTEDFSSPQDIENLTNTYYNISVTDDRGYSYSEELVREQFLRFTTLTQNTLKTFKETGVIAPATDFNKDGKKNVIDLIYAKRKVAKFAKLTKDVEMAKTPILPVFRRGIDVSGWNGDIDWARVKASGFVEYVAIRAGYGGDRTDIYDTRQVDKRFYQNIQGAQKVGIPCGVYWYSYATTPEQARQEAYYCLDTIYGYKLDYPVWFDIEESRQVALGKEKVSEIIETFCSTIENFGYLTGVYTFNSMLESCVSSSIKSRYYVWVADVRENVSHHYEYDLWQYSWKGSIPGMNGDVDLSYCYTDFPEIIRRLKK